MFGFKMLIFHGFLGVLAGQKEHPINKPQGPETNSKSPWKQAGPQKEFHLPTIDFQGLCGFQGGYGTLQAVTY